MYRIFNHHARILPVEQPKVEALMASLASPQDRLWPVGKWPRMLFDRGLEIGAQGGHGPIRYRVEDYIAGDRIVFRFERPGLLKGTHSFRVRNDKQGCVLSHTIEARPGWYGWLLWPWFVRPLHNALVEDALDRAEFELTGQVKRPAIWSGYVRCLRHLAKIVLPK